MTNVPPTDYDRAVGVHLAPTAPAFPPPPAPTPPARPTPPAPPVPPRSPGRRVLGVIAAIALVLAPAIIGYQVGQSNDSSTGPSAINQPSSNLPSNDSQSSGSSNGSSSSSSGSGASGAFDPGAIAAKVDDSVININTALYPEGAAAGSGILISSQGIAITNNHVIADSTEIRVEVPATGKTYSATVLGYNVVADVAVIQLEGASGLKAADLGNSEDLVIGDAIVALGNAGGAGGPPKIVSGAVTGLGEEITASESDGTDVQRLTDLIKVNANILSGDSGGPLVDDTGAVVGMNAAASARNGLGGFPSAGGEGYAIPIEKAIAIAKRILSKERAADIHLGANRALIGVSVTEDSASVNRGGSLGGRTGSGALVEEVTSGSGADKAGIAKGSTITAVNGAAVTSSTALKQIMVPYQPGDSVEITWTDSAGASHRDTIKLGSGPPA